MSAFKQFSVTHYVMLVLSSAKNRPKSKELIATVMSRQNSQIQKALDRLSKHDCILIHTKDGKIEYSLSPKGRECMLVMARENARVKDRSHHAC